MEFEILAACMTAAEQSYRKKRGFDLQPTIQADPPRLQGSRESSTIETLVARTTRSLAVPAKAKQMKNPLPNSAENIAEARPVRFPRYAKCL